jgi:hypothetical protein
MIYLIDDNQNNQRENLGIGFVDDDTFNGYLTAVEKIEKRETSYIFHLEFLKNADCILLHFTTEDYDKEKDTFISGSRTNAVKIIETIAEEGDKIPLALFSNDRIGEPVYFPEKPPNYLKINKNDFYKHLYAFLEHYKNTGAVEFRILMWGKNFNAREVAQLAESLLEPVASASETDKFTISHLRDTQQEFKRFVTLSLPDADSQDILNDLENNPVTIADFKNKINFITESFVKYGKNIYPWK